MKNENEALSANALKDQLWDTMKELRAKKIDARTANAVCGAASSILGIIKTEIIMAKMLGKKMPSETTKFLLPAKK